MIPGKRRASVVYVHDPAGTRLDQNGAVVDHDILIFDIRHLDGV